MRAAKGSPCVGINIGLCSRSDRRLWPTPQCIPGEKYLRDLRITLRIGGLALGEPTRVLARVAFGAQREACALLSDCLLFWLGRLRRLGMNFQRDSHAEPTKQR
jgi:hypothetical protein